jgi:hypothetical protein
MRHHEVVGRHQQLEPEREMLLTQHQELAANNRLSRKVGAFAHRVRRGVDTLDFEQRERLVRLLVEQVQIRLNPHSQLRTTQRGSGSRLAAGFLA